MATTDEVIAFAGCGSTALSREVAESEVALGVTACRNAIEDAGLDPTRIDGINIQVHHHPPPDTDAIIDQLGMETVRWREDGGIGVSSVVRAASMIDSGACESIVVCKIMNTTATVMTPPIDPETFRVAGREQFEVPYGLGYTMQHVAMATRRWMSDHGVTAEQVGALCVTQRQHAALNPRAILRDKPLTVEEYLESRWIAEPLRVLDCDYPVNGAYAYVLTTGEQARGLRHVPVHLTAWAEAPSAAQPTFDPAVLTRSTDWLSEMYRDARCVPADIDVWLLYDGFSVLAMQWMEALGLAPPGGSGELVCSGRGVRFDGEHPVNTHGGQLSEGRLHGTGQILEAIQQLRGTAGGRQVAGARHAVVATGFPGSGAAAILAVRLMSAADVGTRLGQERLKRTGRRPLPQPDELTAPYWRAAARGELRVMTCDACGANRHPPTPACPRCTSDRHRWAQLSGLGTVHSFIVDRRLMVPGFDQPYVVVLVAPDDADEVFIVANLCECPVSDVHIGMPVEVFFEKVEDMTLPQFRPRREA